MSETIATSIPSVDLPAYKLVTIQGDVPKQPSLCNFVPIVVYVQQNFYQYLAT